MKNGECVKMIARKISLELDETDLEVLARNEISRIRILPWYEAKDFAEMKWELPE